MTIAGIRLTIIKGIRIRETTKRAIAGMTDMTGAPTIGMIPAATILRTIAELVTYRGGNGEMIADIKGPLTIP